MQGLQELALPRTGDGGLVRSLREARDTPYKQPEGGEDHPAEHEDQPPEPGGQREQEDPTEEEWNEHGEARGDLGPRAHLIHFEAEEVVRVAPLMAVSSVTGLRVAVWSLLHRLASSLNISASLLIDHTKVLTSSQSQRRVSRWSRESGWTGRGKSYSGSSTSFSGCLLSRPVRTRTESSAAARVGSRGSWKRLEPKQASWRRKDTQWSTPRSGRATPRSSPTATTTCSRRSPWISGRATRSGRRSGTAASTPAASLTTRPTCSPAYRPCAYI